MVGWHEDGDDLEAMKRHEAALGKRFAIVRLYNQWRLPGRRMSAMVGDGRLVISSHKPPAPRAGGWAAVAAGREDATIRQLADAYRAYGREVIFSFHHEPHDDAADVKRGGRYGRASDYTAAWRRIHRIFVERGAHVSSGGHVLFGYIATGSQALAGTPAGSADRLYPGSDVVDVLAHDRYNWASCRRESWESFATNWEPLVNLAASLQKPIIPGEFGSPPSGGRRNQWFRDAAAWIKSNPQARTWMLGFAYYHSFHDSCHWDFMKQGTDGRIGWTEAFSSDDHFVGTPFSVAPTTSPPPAPTAPAPPAPTQPAPSPVAPEARPSRSWASPDRRPGGIPRGYGEMSGFASSRRHAGWAWGVRDSGNPASLYAFRTTGSPASFTLREFPVRGASNRDWEDVVYAEENGSAFLYVVDTGGKRIYKLPEPDPTGPATAKVAAVYPYAFADASPRSTCGPRHNVEAAFVFPALTGQLHIVRKMKSPAQVYRFDRLVAGRTNVPVPAGTIPDASCISVASVSADSRLLLTASHSSMRIREGTGDVAGLLSGPAVYGARISPDNNEAGDFYPWGSRHVVIAAENRTTWYARNR